MTLTKNHFKIITRLQQKKYRQTSQLFVAEGVKVVTEFLEASFKVKWLFATDDFMPEDTTIIRVSSSELKKMSQLTTPNKVLAVFEIPKEKAIKTNGLVVALDAVNDPGNLGTIIRLCDWFGVQQLICSKNTVDCYNFKVVQASMGSLTRVAIVYTDLVAFLSQTKLPKYTADMHGENVYQINLPKEGVLVMGNEANGLSEAVRKLSSTVLSIPRFGELQATESLNVATATAILLSEFRRGL